MYPDPTMLSLIADARRTADLLPRRVRRTRYGRRLLTRLFVR